MNRELRLRFWLLFLIGANILVSILLLIATAADVPNIRHALDVCESEESLKSLRCEVYERLSQLGENKLTSATALSLLLIGSLVFYIIASAWALVGASYHSHRSLLPFLLLSPIVIPSISTVATLIVGSGGSLQDILSISGFSLLYSITLCLCIIYYFVREAARRQNIPYNRFAAKF